MTQTPAEPAQPPGSAPAVTVLDEPTAKCVAPGCGGTIVRHSLGGGQSIRRCTRCFRRYRLRTAPNNN